MAVTENDTNDSLDESDDENEYRWEVAGDGQSLRKTGFSDYEYEIGGVVIPFEAVKTTRDDGMIELRDDDYNTHAVIDPESPSHPPEIRTGFRILREEL